MMYHTCIMFDICMIYDVALTYDRLSLEVKLPTYGQIDATTAVKRVREEKELENRERQKKEDTCFSNALRLQRVDK